MVRNADNFPPEPRRDELVDQEQVLELLAGTPVDSARILTIWMDQGKLPRPRNVVIGVNDRGRKVWAQRWRRGEVMAALQAITLERLGQLLTEADAEARHAAKSPP